MHYSLNGEDNNRPVLGADETILWDAKPKKSAYILSKSLILFPIAIVWLIIDGSMLISAIQEGEMLYFLIPFFALHLAPVWIWLANLLSASRRWRNTTYYVTNRRIIIQSGFFAVNEQSLYFKDIPQVHLQIGLLNKLFHTGTISFSADESQRSLGKEAGIAFENVTEADDAYQFIQKTVLDIQTDMEYPNAYRPADNPGYQTRYDNKQ